MSNGKAQLVINSSTNGFPDLQDPNGVNWFFMPSAALDENGNMGFTFTTSGPQCSSCSQQPHPALNFVVLPWASTTFDTPTVIVQGTGDQENQDRYGEYASTVVDSTDAAGIRSRSLFLLAHTCHSIMFELRNYCVAQYGDRRD